ncbi:predicted protein [Histoplasma capsulatum G186AR]|uniref:Uncharacterized protein n=2 Tax=Ajellomyces capsulatus TaxID=5037 RepID=C0NIA8_AJECG|nr:uncharacterized protein HCBG_03080 [Histoplasma capsulatum G186AR]EEH09543.1 predicted protein [Histoplasma capsulatum G186AR]
MPAQVDSKHLRQVAALDSIPGFWTCYGLPGSGSVLYRVTGLEEIMADLETATHRSRQKWIRGLFRGICMSFYFGDEARNPTVASFHYSCPAPHPYVVLHT